MLLALADRARDDGSNAWPSVQTIGDEAELSVRTVQGLLPVLEKLGLIAEQAPPRQHRPRTWRIDLDRVHALRAASLPDTAVASTAGSNSMDARTERHLAMVRNMTGGGHYAGQAEQTAAKLREVRRPEGSDQQNAAPLNPSGAQLVAPLNTAAPQDAAVLMADDARRVLESLPGPQISHPGPQVWPQARKNDAPGPQHVADELSSLNCPLNSHTNRRALDEKNRKTLASEADRLIEAGCQDDTLPEALRARASELELAVDDAQVYRQALAAGMRRRAQRVKVMP